MKRFFASFLVFSFLLTFNSPSLAHDGSKKTGVAMPGINVLVCNHAQVPGQTLDQAEREVARIFHDVGIGVTWRNCNPEMTGIHQDVNRTQGVRPTDLILRIVPEITVSPGVSHDTTMGFAIGNHASISFRRVRQEAVKFGVEPDEVLGPAVAHEIGHLLGQQGHSPTGIMRERWERMDYKIPPPSAFRFTPEQAKQMRTEVREHERQQATEAPNLTTYSQRSPGVAPL